MKLRDEVAEFEASAVRDLMAILTGPAATDMDRDFSPSSDDGGVKRENSVEETEDFDGAPLPPSPQSYPPAACADQVINSHSHHVLPEKPCVRNDFSNYFPALCTTNGSDFAAQLFQTSAPIQARHDERRVHGRGPDPFMDPYDCSLGTPIFSEPNLEASAQEPKYRNFDTSGMVFSFDFEENVWSWLDQLQ